MEADLMVRHVYAPRARETERERRGRYLFSWMYEDLCEFSNEMDAVFLDKDHSIVPMVLPGSIYLSNARVLSGNVGCRRSKG